MRSTRIASWGLALLIFVLSLACRGAAAETRPNVVLVMTDDQGYGDLGCHGNPVIQTPNLDALHKESVRLTNFHVDPTCSPTRAALLTGRYSQRTGVWHTIMGRSLLRRDEITIADHFSKAGYATGAFGKWHLGDNYPFRPQHRGFQETLVHGGGGVGQTPDFWGNDYFDDVYWRNGKPEKTEGYCTKVFFDAALEFIAASKKAQKPFFCYVPTNVPHGPYLVAEKYQKMYLDAGVKGRTAAFYGMITEFDENFGRLLKTLKDHEVERNTILIFMTDNGTAAGGFPAGMRGRKGSEYDGGHRVPFFLRWPAKLEGGRDIDTLTAHIDVLPTLLDLCGLDAAKGRKIDGMSLRPLLEKRVEKWPDRPVFVQSHRLELPQLWRKSSVMTQRWRLVNGAELYDIQADPGQKKDVAKDHPDVVNALRTAYKTHYVDSSTQFDTFCEIVLGSPQENPTTLTCHDWHSNRVPWNQPAVRKTPVANGFWAVEVEKAGKYAFVLRTRPRGDETLPFSSGTASVTVGEVSAKADIEPGSREVRIVLELPAGKTRLRTEIAENGKKPRGAFFVTVKRLTP